MSDERAVQFPVTWTKAPETTNEELADALEAATEPNYILGAGDKWRLREAARRLREMPDGERKALELLVAHERGLNPPGIASSVHGLHCVYCDWSDDSYSAKIEHEDDCPITIGLAVLHPQEPTAQKRTERPSSSEEKNDG